MQKDQSVCGTESVVLADSHHDMLEGMRGLLETQFAVVVMVTDEKSLLEAVSKLQPVMAVVDLGMPRGADVNVARRLKRSSPDLRFIVVSVHDESTVVREIMDAGASGYVLKRTAAIDLIPAVHAVRQGARYVSPSLSQNY